MNLYKIIWHGQAWYGLGSKPHVAVSRFIESRWRALSPGACIELKIEAIGKAPRCPHRHAYIPGGGQEQAWARACWICKQDLANKMRAAEAPA